MTGTLKAQLVQHGMADRIEEVLEETATVRRELGYPGMATPFSQLVGTLAVLNVVTGKRYSVIPDEVIQYAAGYYGQTVAPIEPDIMDRIMSSSRAKEVLAKPREQPSAEDLRKQFGTDNDDELILRALVPGPALDKMRAAGPVKTYFPLLSSPELDQVRKLLKVANLPLVQVKSQAMTLTLRRHDTA
jgi:oxaloacetate decarboxylase alpha subunit